MFYNSDIKRIKLYLWIGLAHLLLWLLFLLAAYSETFKYRAVNQILLSLYLLAANFVLYNFVAPKLSFKHLIRSMLLIILMVLIFSLGSYVWRYIAIAAHIYTPLINYENAGLGIADQLGAGLFSVIFYGIIIHIHDYRKLKASAQQLRIEKQEAELNFLKSQTNPHFLFNTLNNIYSLAKDKSEIAPESILKLSKILRFMLYETGVEFIAIEEELKIISDYIALERLRYDETLKINFNYDIENLKQSLPPLLLIPLIENAFKHGTSETREHPFIVINLSVKMQKLNLIVKNSIEQYSDDFNISERIGLSNLRRQLELLYKEFSLNVHKDECSFTSELEINLKSHV